MYYILPYRNSVLKMFERLVTFVLKIIICFVYYIPKLRSVPILFSLSTALINLFAIHELICSLRLTSQLLKMDDTYIFKLFCFRNTLESNKVMNFELVFVSCEFTKSFERRRKTEYINQLNLNKHGSYSYH